MLRGWWIAGTALPAAVIAAEWAFGLGARAAIDLFPSRLHLLLAFTIPVANWIALGRQGDRAGAAGFAAGVVLPYAALALPVLPAAVALLPLGGAGLLALWPLGALAASWRAGALQGWRFLMLALLLHAVAQTPFVATAAALRRATSGIPEESRSGVRFLRAFGSEARLAAACEAVPPMAFDVSRLLRPQPDQARGVYFLATGRECPVAAPGIAWTSSRFDATLDPAGAAAAVSWTIELARSHTGPRELRLGIDLPPAAVVTGGALNGQDLRIAPSADASPAALRIETEGGDRALIRCRLDPGLSRIRIRLNFAAPPVVREDGLRYFLPRIAHSNAFMAPRFRHILSSGGKASQFAEPAPGAPAYSIGAATAIFACAGGPGAAGAVCQFPVDRHGGFPATVAVVVDGSAPMAPHAPAILRALENLPDGTAAGAIAGTDLPGRVERNAAQRIAAYRYEGGSDAAPALAAAQRWAAREEGAAIVWIHGPQPLDPAPVRWLLRREHFYAIAARSGENRLLDAALAAGSVTRVPRAGTLESDLVHLFRHWGGGPALERIRLAAPPPDAAVAPPALVRIWAGEEAARLAAVGMPDRAASLAVSQGILSPFTVAHAGIAETIPRTD
ncbi:MAG: hypothetical protein IPM24_12605 [Bryobacterales bacterium]|nr:hypothetical protein [Bryobacterales bacterium]